MMLPPPGHLVAAAAAAVALSLVAWRLRALSLSGTIAASIVGFLLFGFAGRAGAAALLLFFATSTALSRVGKRRKAALDYEKGGERDAAQVLANGGVAAACALFIPGLSIMSTVPVAARALLGALAAANADTWATEVGSLAAGTPRMIITGRPAATGASGAVSLPGTLAAVAGSVVIAATAPLFGRSSLHSMLAVAAGGVAGCLVDSLLGATLQVQYRCAVCDRLTERHSHHGIPTAHARGLTWMNNDVVNLLATAAGALAAVLLG
jgi:uncharacterized protein (TIGR00297 family)